MTSRGLGRNPSGSPFSTAISTPSRRGGSSPGPTASLRPRSAIDPRLHSLAYISAQVTCSGLMRVLGPGLLLQHMRVVGTPFGQDPRCLWFQAPCGLSAFSRSNGGLRNVVLLHHGGAAQGSGRVGQTELDCGSGLRAQAR